MATTRQDAWTDEEDLLLAEIVLRHIREGGTQLSAFKEVGRHLSRTPAACGFRWNSYVRKQYKEQIDEAKRMRKTAALSQVEEATEPLKRKEQEAAAITFDDVIAFLQGYKEKNDGREEKEIYEKIETLQREREQLQKEKEWLLKRLSLYEEEYRTLFDYIDQKRNVMSGEREKKIQLLRERNVLEKIEK